MTTSVPITVEILREKIDRFGWGRFIQLLYQNSRVDKEDFRKLGLDYEFITAETACQYNDSGSRDNNQDIVFRINEEFFMLSHYYDSWEEMLDHSSNPNCFDINKVKPVERTVIDYVQAN